MAKKIKKPRKKTPTKKASGGATKRKRPAKKKQTNLSPEEAAQRQRDAKSEWATKTRNSARDIAPDFPVDKINWTRRKKAERDLKFFCQTYLKPIFYLGWSDDQKRCVRKVEQIFLEGGMFALAMPRGGGKTAICRAGMIWGTAFGHRRFPYFIGSTQPKAEQSLSALKMIWYRNKLLQQDFPEVAYPIYRLENRTHLARSQTFNGEATHIEWGSECVRYACLLMTEEQANAYLSPKNKMKDGEPFVRPVEDYPGRYVARSAGVYIGTAGIDGSIRGEAEIHPITLEQPRPDVVLLDDVQKDQKAESPASCDKIIRLIDGAIQGLAGPGEHISALMPCTVIREGDAADTYLDKMKKPEWQGERCQMVLSWPEGITDYEITLETEAGRLWNEYADLRRKSLHLYKDIRLATRHYRKNKKVMDNGFKVSWKDRYTKAKGPNKELSAQQHAMNLRLKSPDSFPPEFQNRGRRLYEEGQMMITSAQLREKVVSLKRLELPVDTQHLVAFIDVQNEILFWSAFACTNDFTGIIPAYGTWPPISSRYFTKANTESWNLLTTGFFNQYPQHRDKAVRTSKGKVRAPLEAKIYWALGEALRYINSLSFVRQDGHQTVLPIAKLAIDTRWGQVSDVIKRFIRESGQHMKLLPYFGQALPPTHRQFEEYTRTRGWLFEDQVSPQVKEVKWVVRPNPDGQYYMSADVNRLKDFLFSRLGSPLGSSGSIALYEDLPERHEMFADHICISEYPEPSTARGMTKNLWQTRDRSCDNDWLDCMVGCMALAGLCGAATRPNQEDKKAKKPGGRRMTDRWRRAKRNDRMS